jgi:glucokinase
MTILVADVGGTNARLGLAHDMELFQGSIQRFENADFASFGDVVRQFLAGVDGVNISTCVIAVAGPVSATQAKLTNLDWVITADELGGITGCENTFFLNDLAALGYSLAQLPVDGTSFVSEGVKVAPENAQYLVVGMGTGFNVCAVKNDMTAVPICLQAECGHIALPADIGPSGTVEELFSGRGFAAFYNAMADGPALSGFEISQQHGAGVNPVATQALEQYGHKLGLLTRELALMYMPTGGIYFAGSVARGVFDAGMDQQFLAGLNASDHFLNAMGDIPIGVIRDDAAGLLGCAVAARALMR